MHVVAHQPGQTSVTLWVQAEQVETDWTIEVVGPGAALAPITDVTSMPDLLTNVLPGQSDIRIWTYPLKNLVPGAIYTVWVSAPFVPEPTVAATFRTLPGDLRDPFTVLLASCYSEDSDLAVPIGQGLAGEVFRAVTQKLRRGYVTTRSTIQREIVGATPRGNVSRRYKLLCEEHGVPDLKILTGDQVYLDTPLVLPMFGGGIGRRISRTYSRTWDKLGFLLSHGANICASDDHEFWNNYPYRPPFITNLLGLRGQRARDEWERTAREFVRYIQLARPTVAFDLGGDLSFYVADTRINRDRPTPDDPTATPRFMLSRDLNELIDWIRDLTAPGVLVLGQPLLAKTNPKDRGLPDFPEQYARLCDALVSAPQDVVVLSGDVHFGRVAEIEVQRPDQERGVRLFEVISSPMALVSLFRGKIALAAGEFVDDITEFPISTAGGATGSMVGVGAGSVVGGAVGSRAAVGHVRYEVPVESSGRRCEDHYMTLRFTKRGDGAGITVEVLAHLLRKPPANQPAKVQRICELTLGAAWEPHV